ncbi:unnamed protein product [Amoebophrya sp. A25]|nr:unnamed protein product [Amoebophrya sp. A25]|eukprot:GSA25T00011222001.1
MQVRLYSVLDHEGATGVVATPIAAPASSTKTKSKKRKNRQGADEDDAEDANRLADGENREEDGEENGPGAASTFKRLGRLGKLLGHKASKSYGGFKPVIFAELRQAVRGSFFSENKEHVICVCKDGVVATWRFKVDEAALSSSKSKTRVDEASLDDFDWNKHEKKENGEEEEHLQIGTAASASFSAFLARSRDAIKTKKTYDPENDILLKPGEWTCASKVFMNLPNGQKITETAFNIKTNVVVAGLTQGVFSLYEVLPSLSLLHTLSIGGYSAIDSIAFNNTGEWVALGSSAAGQLLVWEWQSETYVLKQQGHHWGVQCCAFAPSVIRNAGAKAELTSNAGQGGSVGSQQGVLATGGYDGKVKLWNTVSGFNFVTFTEHTAEVRDIIFTPQANAVISASADGSVRAFDLLRYRNFRTFVSPPSEKKIFGFESVATDGGGEIVAAAAKGDTYSVLVWSIQTGQLLDIVTGHEAPVSCLRFSSNPAKPGELATGSWDGNLTVSDIFKRAKGAAPEKLQCGASVLALAYDPRGNNMIACSSLAGHISFWDVEHGCIRGSVEGIRDVKSGRDSKGAMSAVNNRGKTKKDKYKFSLEFVNLNQHFSSIAYTASGALLLASSRNSPHVCLYSTSAYELVQRYTLTNNQSLTGIKVLLNSSKTVADGEAWADFDLSDSDADDHVRKQRRIKDTEALPGVVNGEKSKTYSQNQFHCWNCDFSMDGKSFAVATSHGLHLYAIDSGTESELSTYGTALERFQPAILTENVSIPRILQALREQDLTKAFILALALNDAQVLLQLYDRIDLKKMPAVVQSVGGALLPTLLHFLSCMLHPTWGTVSVERHVCWLEAVLETHISTLLQWTSGGNRPRELPNTSVKGTSSAGAANGDVAATSSDPILMNTKVQVGEVQALLLQCLQGMTQKFTKLQQVFDRNSHALTYLSACAFAIADDDDACQEEQQGEK